MKIALICPSNKLYMPYVENYEKILNKNKVDFDIINWDRFHIESKDNSLIYRDFKTGHSRNIIDYFRYKKFIVKKLNEIKYDKIIVFGIQLAFVLKSFLKKYRYNYIFDIRDYNKVLRFYDIGKIIKNSAYTVISSPGYKEWLPKSDKYITNHNTKLEFIKDVTDRNYLLEIDSDINISYIGTIRDLDINIKLINSLKNKKKFNLYFHGEGIVNDELRKYLDDNDINNVTLTGRYKREEEPKLYDNSDFINVLIPNTDINSRTLLPNRLYNAVIFGKPIITFEGTYLANLVTENQLGLVINSFNNLDKDIEEFLNNFNTLVYLRKRLTFLESIINENRAFEMKLKKFIASKV